MFIRSRLALAVGGALALSFIAVPAVQADDGSAENKTGNAEQRIKEAQERVEQAKQAAEERRVKAKETAEKKLEDTKLRVCQNREKAINNVMDRIGKRGDRHIELIDRVSERVQAFYREKNLSVTDYDSLLAKVNSAKATAQSAADAVTTAQADFKCEGDDPNGAAASFKSLMLARNDAVKAYRDAVKDLVKAVKTAAQADRATGGEQ